ncbi:MAG: hypothetical protein D6677_08445 [Calditrichaeota bacterium]|nr:MAG: hypothetical protein D6677_08445 [Calditrichota bacterium]
MKLKDKIAFEEKKHILNVLQSVAGKLNKAAEILDVERTTLFKKMKKYGIEKEQFKP